MWLISGVYCRRELLKFNYLNLEGLRHFRIEIDICTCLQCWAQKDKVPASRQSSGFDKEGRKKKKTLICKEAICWSKGLKRLLGFSRFKDQFKLGLQRSYRMGLEGKQTMWRGATFELRDLVSFWLLATFGQRHKMAISWHQSVSSESSGENVHNLWYQDEDHPDQKNVFTFWFLSIHAMLELKFKAVLLFLLIFCISGDQRDCLGIKTVAYRK